MRLRTRSLLVTVALAAAAVAAPAGAGTIPKTNDCGTIATQNGGKAKYIRSYKIGCTTAKAVAGRANGKTFTASRFTCRRTGPTYLCTKLKSKQTIVFTYKKPAARASAAAAKTHRCGTLTAANGGKVANLSAIGTGCRTAKAVARPATGRTSSYKARGFMCRIAGPAYFCTRNTPRALVAFSYKKPS